MPTHSSSSLRPIKKNESHNKTTATATMTTVMMLITVQHGSVDTVVRAMNVKYIKYLPLYITV